ncbi:unnamed protein product [Symbiodinium natans]|uniref:AarF domain-containing protein kinase 1 n=1 Tax=Symbiodinium natans TaxID=878477 RepID=A0A812SZ29_9DINO|nr:unnamed protein product [Symbiodinium natans]
MAESRRQVHDNADAVDDAAKLIRVNAHIVTGAVSQALMLGGAKLKQGDVTGALRAVDESIVEAREKAAEANRSFRSAAWSAACVLLLVAAIGACWGLEHLLTLRGGEADAGVGVPNVDGQDQYHPFPGLGLLRFLLSCMVLLYNFYPWSTQAVMSLCCASPAPDAQLRGASQRRASQRTDLGQCGIRGHAQQDGTRIMHGKSAAQCSWRWQVSLHDVRKNTTKSSHFCGGTLIDRRWVLTAAHCVGSFSQCDLRFVRVIAGAWKHSSESRLREGTSAERGVVRVHTHPRYGNAAPSDNDFALVELDEQMPINDCIGIACLPTQNGGQKEPWTKESQQCSITGWGESQDAEDAGGVPSTLQEGSVSTLSHEACVKDYAPHNATITASMLCASGRSDTGITDACYGDSGGPLVCKEQDRYVVHGITSWGLGCASEKFPGVYSRVTAALDWIHDTVSGNSASSAPTHFNGAMWTVTSGKCTLDSSKCILRHPVNTFKLGASGCSHVLHPERLLPKLLEAHWAEGLLGAAWATDEYCLHQVGQRTARTVKTGVYLLWQYKVCWTPETSNEVHAKVAKRLVECLRRNEGLYVKFGQAMSTMDLILPEEYKCELKTLHDQAATFEFPQVKRVIESQLGRSLDEMFSEFEETPIASASIAQVHRAKLRPEFAEGHDGKKSLAVAVKVQKPNIPAQNRCDLAVYKLMLVVLEYAFDLPMVWTYGYTRQQLEAELDFRIEARHARQAAAELACHFSGKVVVPDVQGKVSGQHVLVMDWVDSLGPASDSRALQKAGLRPADVMRTATEVFGYQIFSTGHVHCDPHPGNLLVRLAPAGSSQKWQLVLLDHGLYCELSPSLRRDYADFWVAAALGDTDTTVQICKRWGIADQDAAELFASLTQFRRVRLGAQRLDAMASLFGSQRKTRADVLPHAPKKLTAKAMAEAQQKLKARAKKVLSDTAAFPRELLFVGRSLNMIRSANFALGTAVNRVAILAECAAAGATLQGGSLASRRMAVWNFHLRVQCLLFLSKLVQIWQGLSSFGLAPAVLGLTGLLLRVSTGTVLSKDPKGSTLREIPGDPHLLQVKAEHQTAIVEPRQRQSEMERWQGKLPKASAAIEEEMLSAMVVRIMAWYPFYVITLIFLCVQYFSYSAWDWTSFMAHVFLISGGFQEHREAVFPYMPCSWWFTCLAAYTLAWLPMHNILKISSDSVIWTMFVMATAVVIPSVLLEWLFFKDMAIFELLQYSFAFFYGQALAVWQAGSSQATRREGTQRKRLESFSHTVTLAPARYTVGRRTPQVPQAICTEVLRLLPVLTGSDGCHLRFRKVTIAASSVEGLPSGAQIEPPKFADLQSTVLDWPDGSGESGAPLPAADVPKNELARSKKLNKGKNPAKKAGVQKYDARGHRVRHRKEAKQKRPPAEVASGFGELETSEGTEQPGPETTAAEVESDTKAPRPPRPVAPRAPVSGTAGKPTSALLSMARSAKSFSPPKRAYKSMSSAKLEPLQPLQPDKESQLAFGEAPLLADPLSKFSLGPHVDVRSRPPSNSSFSHAGSGLVRAASAASVGPLRRDIPVPSALHPGSFQRRARHMDAVMDLRHLQEKIRNPNCSEDKKIQVADLAMRDLRADLSHMLKRSAVKVQSFAQPVSAPRSVDDVFASQVAKFQEPLTAAQKVVQPARERGSTAASTTQDDEEDYFGEDPPDIDVGEDEAGGETRQPTSPVASELLSPIADKQKMKSALRRHSRGSARVSWERLPYEEGGADAGLGSLPLGSLPLGAAAASPLGAATAPLGAATASLGAAPDSLQKSIVSSQSSIMSFTGDISVSGEMMHRVSSIMTQKGQTTGLKNIKRSFEPTLRKRLGEAFARLCEANELHRDSLPQAVELTGWTVTAEVKQLINSAFDSLFQYNTLNQKEFFQFFEKFRQLEKQRAFEAFNSFDADASGTIDFDELGALLESQGIFPLQHVIYELAMDACDGNLVDGLDFSEFQRVLEILREREGFTREEIERIEDAFDKCDSDGSGSLDLLEISRVLAILGYSRDMKYQDLLAEVDTENSNQLSKRDFTVLMRKIQERNTQYIKDYFRECDTDGEPGLDAREISLLLQALGYLPDMACILETMLQLGLDDPEEDLDFSQVWRFLEIYRRQHGLTLGAINEALDIFKRFAADDDTVSVDCLLKMLRMMGFDLHYHEVRRLMYLVESSESSVMNEKEFVMVLGHLRDRELRQMWKVVNEPCNSPAAQEIKERFNKEMLGISRHRDEKSHRKKVTFMEFIPWATQLRNQQREVVRRRHGFGKEEVDVFKCDFNSCQRDASGRIRASDLRQLLTQKFPMLATMKDNRAKLSEILAGKEPGSRVGLDEFLALSRVCVDIVELEKLKRERNAIEERDFTPAEVLEFRSLFMSQATSSGLPGTYRNRLSFDELVELLARVIPLGYKNAQVLKREVRQVHKHGPGGDDSVNFVEFLNLMERLLAMNFGGMATLGKTSSITERASEDKPESHPQGAQVENAVEVSAS